MEPNASPLTVSLTLDGPLRQFVEAEVACGGFGNATEFVQALLEAEHRRRAEGALRDLLLEGVRSSRAAVADDAWWDRYRARLQERRAARPQAEAP
jgi:Arc/MetJ-type ribon-helix-helix transcriptional regulator